MGLCLIVGEDGGVVLVGCGAVKVESHHAGREDAGKSQ